MLKSILSRILLSLRAVGRRLPSNWQQAIRARLAPLALRVAPEGAQAAAYVQIRRQRATRITVHSQTGPVDAANEEALWDSISATDDSLSFVIFSAKQWDVRPGRLQSLSRELALQGNRVVYVSADLIRSDREPSFEAIQKPVENVMVARLSCPESSPRSPDAALSEEEAEFIAHSLSLLEREMGMLRVAHVVDDPFWHAILRYQDVGTLVYDLASDTAVPPPGKDIEARLIEDADLVVVASDRLPTRITTAQAVTIIEDGEDIESTGRLERDHEGTVPSEQTQDRTWAQRASQLESSVRALWPKVSVVVVCWGQLALTKACLRSIFAETDYVDWEVVVVDNASPDGTVEWLERVAARTNRVRLVVNEKNIGFAEGNNTGVRQAGGRYLVMLNNDTIVTRGWATRLVRHLQRTSALGLVGAVTNSIGNEAMIEVQYDSEMTMREVARGYTGRHYRELMDVENIALFAAALTKETWDLLGELDSRFEIGYFEDDDYCRRVRNAGLKIALAEDVFIHHEHSASFDELGEARKREQFDKNLKLYEEKWGPWTPHRYRRRST